MKQDSQALRNFLPESCAVLLPPVKVAELGSPPMAPLMACGQARGWVAVVSSSTGL